MNPLFKITEIYPFSIISNDLAHPWQIGFQDGASPGFSGIIELHDTIFFYLVVIAIGVFWLLGSVMYAYGGDKSKIVHKYLNHGTIKCLSNLVDLEARHLLWRWSGKNNIEDSQENRRNLKLTIKKFSFSFFSTSEILKPSILPTNFIIRKYSNDTFISPISTEADDKLSEKENVTIFSEVDQSLDLLKPVKSYEDTYVYKKEIYKDNKDKAGIYRFFNKINGNFYIGSTTNLKNRFVRYFNLSYISRVRNELTISRALIKYGYSNFRLDILDAYGHVIIQKRTY
jgi:Cytochrome C oxidase subunit II, transmembrane domain/GIY-YIG catalytic domain